ncbi:hypothetical protein MMC17_007645 [Xylographa soralifera]|nr:hypothetical protein [Xylographa soralifera]
MATPPRKRKRADTAGVPQPGPIDNRYLQTILSLPATTIANLLSNAADKHPDVATTVAGLLSYAAEKYPDVAATTPASKGDAVAAERVKAKSNALPTSAKVIDFDHYSKTAWRAINTQYKSIKGCIMDIRKKCPAGASYGTKKSALETLRKIGKTVCMSGGDVIGSEGERDVIVKGDFGVKLEELAELSKDYCVFEKLDEVLALLEGTEGKPRDGEDVEDEDEDDSEDDSDE